MAHVAVRLAYAVMFLSAPVLGSEILDLTHQPYQVLLTGFGAFLNFTSNPTEAIVRHLGAVGCDDVDILPEPSEEASSPRSPAVRLRICWNAHVLPVNRTGALWTTSHLRSLRRLPYDAVFHTGLEDFAKGLKLEVAAANIQAQDSGAAGKVPAVPGALALEPTTVNVGWMTLKNLVIVNGSRGRLSKEVELWSRDPGSYYCNEVYYRTLQLVRSAPITVRTGALLPVMFIHVQNTTESSVHEDVDSVRQVVAHALWATYVAPQAQKEGLSLLGHAEVARAAAPDLASFAVANILLGGVLSWLVCALGRRPRAATLLRAPLKPWGESS